MVDVNVALQDAATRHQVFLQRFGGSSANEAIKILNTAERDLRERLKKRLKRLGPVDRQVFGRGLATTKRMQAMIDEIRVQNRDLRVALGKSLRGNLKDLANAEISIANRRMTEAFGVDLNNLRPSPEVMRSLTQLKSVRLRGRTIGQWFNKFEADRFSRVEAAVRLGVVEGDTIPQIVRRLRLAGEASKVSANALVRTSMNHVANTAREAFYDANSDLIKEVRWTATLDGRTSPICRARDGLTWDLDEPHPRPPAHPNCRSILSPITKSWEELTGGKAKLNPKRLQGPDFEKAMRKDLATRGLNTDQIDAFIKSKALQLSGKIAPTDTYANWLKFQPKEFQDQVLGRVRGELFRRGDLSLDKFVDMKSGRPFNLDALKKMESEAWANAFPTGMARRLPPASKAAVKQFVPSLDDTIPDFEADMISLTGAGQDPRAAFEQAQKQASEWLEQRLPKFTADFTGIHPGHLKPIVEEVSDLAKEFPHVFESWFRYIGTYNKPSLARQASRLRSAGLSVGENARVFKFDSGHWAHAFDRQIGLNPSNSVFGLIDGDLSAALKSTETLFHDKMTNIKHIVRHEFGHVVDNYMRQFVRETLTTTGTARASDLGLVGSTWRSFRNFNWRLHKKALRKIVRDFGRPEDVASLNNVIFFANEAERSAMAKRMTSVYSNMNDKEWWAESFAAIKYGGPEAQASIFVQRAKAGVELIKSRQKWTKLKQFVGEIDDPALKAQANAEIEVWTKKLFGKDLAHAETKEVLTIISPTKAPSISATKSQKALKARQLERRAKRLEARRLEKLKARRQEAARLRKGGAPKSTGFADQQRAWKKTLSEQEKGAIFDYTTEDFQDINWFLRTRKPTLGMDVGRVERITKRLDAAISRSVLTEDIVTYRGVDDAFAETLRKSGARSWKDRGFVSTSLDRQGAELHIRENLDSEGWVLRITAKKGTRAGNVASLSDIPAERELLIGRNTIFRVVKFNDSTRTIDVVTIIGGG